MKFMLIDDDPFQLRLLERHLEQMGHVQWRSHTDPGAALIEFAAEPDVADVVICDLQMPDTDGVELVRHLAHAGFAGGVILISGEDPQVLKTVGELARAHRLQVLGALVKPIRQVDLATVLARLGDKPRAGAHPRAKSYELEEFRRGLAGGEFVNFYQPKVEIRTGRVIGAEALVRWRHPRDGLVMPGRFVDTLEHLGLVDDLTWRVLTTACRDGRKWHDMGLPMSVAVNVSMDSLCALDFPDRVRQIAEATAFPLSNCLLEVTESRLMRDPLAALDVLSRLRLKGVRLSIDDFGTGYSSLSQLRDIPFTELKVDRGFVHGAHCDASLRAILDASLSIARELGMVSVAEGVEDRADWDCLLETSCNAAQGYHLAKPMPAPELADWVRAWHAAHHLASA